MGKKKSKTKPVSNIDITSLLFRTEAHQNMLPEPRETRESGRGLPGPEQLLSPGSAAGREVTHRGRSPHAGHDQTRGEARLRRGARGDCAGGMRMCRSQAASFSLPSAAYQRGSAAPRTPGGDRRGCEAERHQPPAKGKRVLAEGSGNCPGLSPAERCPKWTQVVDAGLSPSGRSRAGPAGDTSVAMCISPYVTPFPPVSFPGYRLGLLW